MHLDEYLLSLREADATTLNATTRVGATDHGQAAGHGFQQELLWSEQLRLHLRDADARGLLRLQFVTEKHYSELLEKETDRHRQDQMLSLAYARVVEFQFLRNEPDMGFSAGERRFVLGIAKRIRRQAAGEPRILEIGCGAGSLLSSLADEGFRRIAGLDLAPGAVDRARERLRVHGLSGNVRQGTPDDLVREGLSDSYDLILACDVIEHVPPARVREFLADVHRLLGANGTFVVITPNALSGPHDVTRHFRPAGAPPEGLHLREYRLGELAGLLEDAGYHQLGAAYPWPSPRPVHHWWLGRAGMRGKLTLEPLLARLPAAVRAAIIRSLFYAGVVARKVEWPPANDSAASSPSID